MLSDFTAGVEVGIENDILQIRDGLPGQLRSNLYAQNEMIVLSFDPMDLNYFHHF